MELVYQGRYFNGKSSHAYTVNLTWQHDGLLLQYVDEKGEQISIVWKREEMHQTEVSSGIVTLRYGDEFPQQQLEVTDVRFIQRYKQEFAVGLMHRVKLTSASFLIGIIFAIGILGWLSYIFLLPEIADYGASIFPKEYEIQLGEQLYASVLEGEDIDSAKTKTINQFFKQLQIKSAYPIKITVVKSEIVNAFALPGGGIVVYDAILRDMKSADQLAALLSHEYSHIQLKHTTRNLFRSLAGYIFVSVIFSDVNGIATILIENAHNLRNLSYSRALETEADNNGLVILRQNHISANGMKDLFKQLKESSNGLEVNEIISTHPDLDSRIKNAENFMKEHPYQLRLNDSLLHYFTELGIDAKWHE
jgi:beta-barrel assembly-enhancing protease